MIDKDKVLGGLYGLLVGDALGVPYEFKRPTQIPPYEQIDMCPPVGYDRAWNHIPPGTYSDDGAQALCLLDTYASSDGGPLNTLALRGRLINWMNNGYMSVDGNTFDIGSQTGAALRSLAAGGVVDPLNKAQFCSNGSLMRSLPVALWLTAEHASDQQLMADAAAHSALTHPYIRNTIAVQMYTIVASRLLYGNGILEAIASSLQALEQHYSNTRYKDEWKIVVTGENCELAGTGYSVDSLWSSLYAVLHATSYEDAVKRAIQYGNDTDTTGCIAGGLAGIVFGLSGIPNRWLEQLRGREDLINPLAAELLLHYAK